MHIRDPIHGAIELTPDERALVDSPQYQRLRNVKQLGFADLAFPGATHTRYAHGLGAMAMATKVFDAVAPQLALDANDRARSRQTLRLAVLFHDLGHAPLSHATEAIMPPVADLRVPEWARESGTRRAGHEDYTLKLVLDSALAAEIRRRFSSGGIEPEHIAGLICGRPPPGAYPYRSGGRDLLPVLRQVVSGELDADRMDYLQRDSFFTGVNYGKFDADWIVQNLAAVQRDDRVYLGLQHRAVFAFEDFLLSRYHMFLSVYFHSTSVGYEVLLQRGCESGEYALPADVDEYLQHDDVAPLGTLRASSNPWARPIRRGGAVASDAAPARAGRRRRVRHGPPRRALALWEGSDALGEVAARRGADRRVHAALRALRGSGDAGALVRRAGEVGRSAPASHFGVSGRTYPANGADAMLRA